MPLSPKSSAEQAKGPQRYSKVPALSLFLETICVRTPCPSNIRHDSYRHARIRGSVAASR